MVRKYFYHIGIIISLLLVMATAQTDAKPHKSSSKEQVAKSIAKSDTATVLKILDGDTFILSGDRRIRLLGMDTPEKGEPFSEAAKNFADSLLFGRHITIEFEKNTQDKYGRLLGYVYANNLLINKLLVERGLARLYLFQGTKKHNNELFSAQKQARDRKLGIWSLPEPAKEPFYISAGGSFRFHRPLCPLIKDINTNKAKRYKTRDSALDAGLSPCRECRP
jgi:micrococcal nuclease